MISDVRDMWLLLLDCRASNDEEKAEAIECSRDHLWSPWSLDASSLSPASLKKAA
jgi:hypothetical protein